MPTEKFFKQLQKDLAPFRSLMARAAEVITDQDVSAYPVMVAAEKLPHIGINIVDREKHASRWYINASTLEELVAKNVVDSAKVEDFKLIYKQSEPQLCLLVIAADQAHFIFLPRTETPS